MSLSSLEARRYAAGPRSGASKIRALNYSVAAQQRYYFKSTSLSPDAVDPALLYAKLEVAKLELKAERHESHDQRRTAREKQHGVAARGSLQGDKALSRRQSELLRRSLPAGAEFMADGKPVFNTAQILAALEETDERSHALSHTTILRHSPGEKSKRTSHEAAMADSKRPSQDSEREDFEHMNKGKHCSAGRRIFKADDSVPTKLVTKKHGSQTTYERVEVPKLIEDMENSDTQLDGATRPRLSKYDRPHWAQQSQASNDLGLLKQAVQSAKRRAPRELSQIPNWEEQDAAMHGGGRHPQTTRAGSVTNDTLIADAVNQIKREERLRKWHSVQNFLKRPPCS